MMTSGPLDWVRVASGKAKAATALVAVPSGATPTTVVAFTPTSEITIIGYSADFKAITNAAYRMRLRLGPEGTSDDGVQHAEELSTSANSWTPLRLTVPGGTRVAIQVVHDQLSAQDVRATVNYETLS